MRGLPMTHGATEKLHIGNNIPMPTAGGKGVASHNVSPEKGLDFSRWWQDNGMEWGRATTLAMPQVTDI